MTSKIKNLIMTDKREVIVKSVNDLSNIDDDCPWKKHEGQSIQEFFEANFQSIKNETLAFTHLLPRFCEEIALTKIFSTTLNRDYWICIYYFGNNENGNPEYLIGGEPETTILVPENFKKEGWTDYPEDILSFWKIHGCWKNGLNNYSKDISLCALSYLRIDNGLPHPSSINTIAKDLDHYLMADDLDPEEICCIDRSNLGYKNEDYWDDEDNDFSIFVKPHL